MEQSEKKLVKTQVISWLKDQEIAFNNYLNDVKKHKARMISPRVQGQVMASAGCIAFIREQLKFLETIEE